MLIFIGWHLHAFDKLHSHLHHIYEYLFVGYSLYQLI